MKKFTLSFLSGILMTGMGYATILVTNQDTTIGVGQSFDLDLDGDGQSDYTFSVHMLTSGYVVYVDAKTDYSVAAKHMHMPDHHDAVLKFAFGDSLGLEWMSGMDSLTMYNGENSTGQWAGATNMYVGFKFINGSDEHWGWIKADVTADGSSLTLKEYGFEDSPNTPITAGQDIASGIQTTKVNDWTYTLANRELTVSGIEQSNNMRFRIIDLSGKQVLSNRIVDNTTISLEGVRSGIYLLELSNDTQSFVEKIFIQ